MKKREIKKTDERLLSHIEVSDGVLDRAREELEGRRKDKKEPRRTVLSIPVSGDGQGQSGTAAQAVSRRRFIIAAACLSIAAAIVLTIFFIQRKNNFGEEPIYALSELERREIDSVAAYNAEYGASYIGASDGVTGASAYSDQARDVLLVENFSYDENECTLYVLTDASDQTVDILQPFYLCRDTTTVSGQEVFYESESFDSAYFYRDGCAYFLSINEGGQESLRSVLEYLIEE